MANFNSLVYSDIEMPPDSEEIEESIRKAIREEEEYLIFVIKLGQGRF